MSAAARERLETWYAGLNPREQLIVRVGAIAGAVLLVVGLVLRLHGVLQSAEKRLAGKRADAAYIQSVLPELRAAPLPASGGQSLVTVVDRTTRDAGLGSVPLRLTPSRAASAACGCASRGPPTSSS